MSKEILNQIDADLERLCREYAIPPNAPPLHLVRDGIKNLAEAGTSSVYTELDAGCGFIVVGDVMINVSQISSVKSGDSGCTITMANGKTISVAAKATDVISNVVKVVDLTGTDPTQ